MSILMMLMINFSYNIELVLTKCNYRRLSFLNYILIVCLNFSELLELCYLIDKYN